MKTSRDRKRLVYASVFVALALGGLGALVYANTRPPQPGIRPAIGAAQEVGERMPVQPGVHIPPPQQAQYSTNPPTSGQHYSLPGQAPTAWGFYDHAVQPEYWVHNLEHGGVVILYTCPTPADSSCADDEHLISEFVSTAPKDSLFQEVKIVATEYPVPGHRFAMVAWGWRLFMDSWDDAAAERFYEAHVDNGPERVP